MATTNHYDLDSDSLLGGNSASDLIIPSQKAVKTYVDNSGGTVDQTFDGTSANAQSGVAIETALTDGSLNLSLDSSIDFANDATITGGAIEISTDYGGSNLLTVNGAQVLTEGTNYFSDGGDASLSSNGLSIYTANANGLIDISESTGYISAYDTATGGQGQFSITPTGFVFNQNDGINNYGTVLTVPADNELAINSVNIATVNDIPTVNNATLTITQGGVSKGTFTANASSDVTIALDAGGGGGTIVQLSPVLTSNGTMGGSDYAVSASSEYSSSYSPYHALDGSSSTWWASQNFDNNAYFTFYSPSAICVKQITYSSQGDNYAKFLDVWGSNDNSNWTKLVDTYGATSAFASIDMSSNVASYNYYKIACTTLNQSNFSIYDLVFYIEAAPANIDLSNLSATGEAHFQAPLVSGTNIKTVNSTSLLGSGNITLVSTSGDTVTGGLVSNVAVANVSLPYIVKFNDVDFDTAPTNTWWGGIEIQDASGNRMGRLEYSKNSDGSHYMAIADKKNSSTGTYSLVRCGFDANGNAYSTIANTTCCDGQWIDLNQALYNGSLYHASDQSFNRSITLPNDGQKYEVMIKADVQTTTTNGSFIAVNVKGNASITSSHINICSALTRASNYTLACGMGTIVATGNTDNITILRRSGYSGTATITALAYRRIGTNT